MDITTIEQVLDKRASRGASDESLIAWLEHLKTVHITETATLDGFISAIRQTPLHKCRPHQCPKCPLMNTCKEWAKLSEIPLA